MVAGEESTSPVVMRMSANCSPPWISLKIQPTGPAALANCEAPTRATTHSASCSRPFFTSIPITVSANEMRTFLVLASARPVARPPLTIGNAMASAAASRSLSLTILLYVFVEVMYAPATMNKPGTPYCHSPVRSAPYVLGSPSQSEVPSVPTISSTPGRPSSGIRKTVGSVGIGIPMIVLTAPIEPSDFRSPTGFSLSSRSWEYAYSVRR